MVEYKPEMTPKVAADLWPLWVRYWASMYISATNLGPFSSEMLIHTSPAPAPSQGHSLLHQSFEQGDSPPPQQQQVCNCPRCNRIFFLFFVCACLTLHLSLITQNIYSAPPASPRSPYSPLLFFYLWNIPGTSFLFCGTPSEVENTYLYLFFYSLGQWVDAAIFLAGDNIMTWRNDFFSHPLYLLIILVIMCQGLCAKGKLKNVACVKVISHCTAHGYGSTDPSANHNQLATHCHAHIVERMFILKIINTPKDVMFTVEHKVLMSFEVVPFRYCYLCTL